MGKWKRKWKTRRGFPLIRSLAHRDTDSECDDAWCGKHRRAEHNNAHFLSLLIIFPSDAREIVVFGFFLLISTLKLDTIFPVHFLTYRALLPLTFNFLFLSFSLQFHATSFALSVDNVTATHITPPNRWSLCARRQSRECESLWIRSGLCQCQ